MKDAILMTETIAERRAFSGAVRALNYEAFMAEAWDLVGRKVEK